MCLQKTPPYQAFGCLFKDGDLIHRKKEPFTHLVLDGGSRRWDMCPAGSGLWPSPTAMWLPRSPFRPGNNLLTLAPTPGSALGQPPWSQQFAGLTFCCPRPRGAKSRQGSCLFICSSNRTPSKCLSKCRVLNVSSGNYFH